MEENKQYEHRYIVFIDILGFKNFVEESEENEDQLKNIHEALNYISRIKRENDEGTLSLKDMGKEVTVFSDSIVISMPVSNNSEGWILLNEVIFLQINLMNLGICIRGGMTAGKLYHKENIVFGPAMNEAYNLESNCAIYPRVIVSSNYLETVYRYGNPLPEIEHDYYKDYLDLLKEDQDGNFYVDFLNQELNVDGREEYLNFLEKTKNSIIQNLDKYNKNLKFS
ncbi:hypothetical protein KIV12_05715 [Bacillus altitudinis]|uniref:hypothetical protein n=1 Tax=Bacillus altitudinis TaxID=293387 RepID=UPI001C3E8DC3|nr:hypothetical protein [Bacillus altitudinis]QXJ49273.1 hypothetical protein KIV12_05715 [Bacillus altitudinis]